MVSRIHNDEFIRKLIAGTELFPSRWIESDEVIVRPRRYDQDPIRRDTLRLNAVFHESIQSYDAISSSQAVQQHAGQQTRDRRFGSQPSRSDCLVGVEVHRPEHKT